MYASIRRLFLATLLLLPLFCACATDRSRDRLADSLFEDYRAEIEYEFSNENGELFGSAEVTKKDQTVLSFDSPELLAGVTAESDESGALDTITFHYYGMRVPLPSGSLSKINALLSLFSDHAATAVVGLPEEEFHDVPDSNENADTSRSARQKSCTIALPNDVTAEIFFDPTDGKPQAFSVYGGENTIKVRVKSWQSLPSELDSEPSAQLDREPPV